MRCSVVCKIFAGSCPRESKYPWLANIATSSSRSTAASLQRRRNQWPSVRHTTWQGTCFVRQGTSLTPWWMRRWHSSWFPIRTQKVHGTKEHRGHQEDNRMRGKGSQQKPNLGRNYAFLLTPILVVQGGLNHKMLRWGFFLLSVPSSTTSDCVFFM